jgi:ABC-type nickel/cobalt efflux system permease component RcnA
MVLNVEMASFALIALVGFFIALSRALSLIRLVRHRPEHPHNGHHQHGEASCGHAHGPTQTDLQNPLSIKGFAGIILSIGIRPCSGAVIVLLLAYSLGLYAAGLFSVMAMSIGTALTVSVLALLSVYARKIVSRFVSSGAGESLSLSGLGDVVGIVGGAVIFMFGTILLSAVLFAPVHPFR